MSAEMSTPRIIVVGTLLALVTGGALMVATLMLDSWRDTPSTPERVTVGGLARAVGHWVEIANAVPLCELEERLFSRDHVPLLDEATGHVVTLRLEERSFCANLQLPVRALVRTGPSPSVASVAQKAQGLLSAEARGQGGEGRTFSVVAGIHLEEDRDRKQEALLGMLGALLFSVVMVVLDVVLLMRLRRRRAQGASSGGRASSTGVPNAGEVIASLAANMEVHPTDALLPGPLKLTVAAQQRARRMRQLGAPALLAGAAVVGLGAGYSALSIVADALAWRSGVEVAAQSKGKITRYQAVAVQTDIDVIYLPPGTEDASERSPEQVSLTFWTWFVGPDTSLGEVRVGSGGRVVISDMVDLWPWRAINPLLLILVVVGLALGARDVVRRSRHLAMVAEAPQEELFTVVQILEHRVNGVRNHWAVHGQVAGKAMEVRLPASDEPKRLLVANAFGQLLLVRARSHPEAHTLVRDDLHPFAVDHAGRVRAQAILNARGSPTRLVG
ncbi:MAG: hypothetical protein AB2A00_02155 [Myxococcota bacterium]